MKLYNNNLLVKKFSLPESAPRPLIALPVERPFEQPLIESESFSAPLLEMVEPVLENRSIEKEVKALGLERLENYPHAPSHLVTDPVSFMKKSKKINFCSKMNKAAEALKKTAHPMESTALYENRLKCALIPDNGSCDFMGRQSLKLAVDQKPVFTENGSSSSGGDVRPPNDKFPLRMQTGNRPTAAASAAVKR